MKLKESYFDGQQIHRGYTDEDDLNNPVMQLLLTEGISSVTIRFDNGTWRRYEFIHAGIEKPVEIPQPQTEPQDTVTPLLERLDESVEAAKKARDNVHKTWYNSGDN